jgi:hypothetical protein
MAISNYLTGEMLDRLTLSPRTIAIGLGALFLIPGVAWFLTQGWWDKEKEIAEDNRSQSENVEVAQSIP